MQHLIFILLFFIIFVPVRAQYAITDDRIDNVEEIKKEITKQCDGTVFIKNKSKAIELIEIDDYYNYQLVKMCVNLALTKKSSLILDQDSWVYDDILKVKRIEVVTYDHDHRFYNILVLYQEYNNTIIFLTERLHNKAELDSLSKVIDSDTLQKDTVNLKSIDK